jgi:ribonuclease HI
MLEQINSQESNLLDELVLVTDGGCKGNPGPGAVGFIIYDRRSGKEIIHGRKRIGETTNNQAEYRALILGLEYASKYTRQRVICLLDSELVVNQANGEYQARDYQIINLYEELKRKERLFKKVEYKRITREHPLIIRVDALVKKTLGR